MAVNKVIYGGNTVIDLTSDSVTPDTLAEGAVAHDKSGAVIHGRMAVVQRTPYIYDDADQRWYDNSEGMYSPDYDMTCPRCGARLQSYLSIDWNPIDTRCPVCDLAITLTNGSVEQREDTGGGGGSEGGGAWFWDTVDQMWWNNSDGVWGTPDYPDMSCPHCAAILQAHYDIDGNPQDTYCPNCANPIQLLDGQVFPTGMAKKWVFRNVVFTDSAPRYDLPALEDGKNYTIVIDNVEGSTAWVDGYASFYSDIWENFWALDYSQYDDWGDGGQRPTWICMEEFVGKRISVYEYIVGASVPTCDVTIKHNVSRISSIDIAYTHVDYQGNVVSSIVTASGTSVNKTLANCVCGSMISIIATGSSITLKNSSAVGATLKKAVQGGSSHYDLWFSVTASNGGAATITLTNTTGGGGSN